MPMKQEINTICVSGEIAWIKQHPEQGRAVFSLRNPNGSFYIEAALEAVQTFQTGDRVMVAGVLYSRFQHGLERTRVQADVVTRLG